MRPWRIALILLAALALLPGGPVGAREPADADTHTLVFGATGQHLTGAFLRYWRANGGLGRFGPPIGPTQHDRTGLIVQWFERARLEYHGNPPGCPRVVETPLGEVAAAERRGEPAFQPIAEPTEPGVAWFPATGHGLRDDFRRFWLVQGGQPILGRPLSEPFVEAEADTGLPLLVQYLEKARLEAPLGADGDRGPVRTGPLGRLLYPAFMRDQQPLPADIPPEPTVTDYEVAARALVERAVGDGLQHASVVVSAADRCLDLTIDADRLLPAASLYKLYALWQTQREINAGRLSDASRLVLTAANDRREDDGYALGRPGESITVAEARALMIATSNNTAAWNLVGAFGWPGLSALPREHGLARVDTHPYEVTTARDIARYLRGIVAEDLDPALTPADYRLMRDLLAGQTINTYLSPGLPPDVTFAHKTGILDDALHDAGVLLLPGDRAIYLTVMTTGDPAVGLALMADLARLTWQEVGE
jgi:hypothetical protein